MKCEVVEEGEDKFQLGDKKKGRSDRSGAREDNIYQSFRDFDLNGTTEDLCKGAWKLLQRGTR